MDLGQHMGEGFVNRHKDVTTRAETLHRAQVGTTYRQGLRNQTWNDKYRSWAGYDLNMKPGRETDTGVNHMASATQEAHG